MDGEELLIAFNPSYLLDGLGVVHADTVRLSFTTPARPALLVPIVKSDEPAESAEAEAEAAATPDIDADGVGSDEDTPAYRYLVMPARLPG